METNGGNAKSMDVVESHRMRSLRERGVFLVSKDGVGI
jgi:hypothetical protein